MWYGKYIMLWIIIWLANKFWTKTPVRLNFQSVVLLSKSYLNQTCQSPVHQSERLCIWNHLRPLRECGSTLCFTSPMVECLEWAPQGCKMHCHDLESMDSTHSWVKLVMHLYFCIIRTWTKIIYYWLSLTRQMKYAPLSLTKLGFELMTSGSWQNISCYWNTLDHATISDSWIIQVVSIDLIVYGYWTIAFCFERIKYCSTQRECSYLLIMSKLNDICWMSAVVKSLGESLGLWQFYHLITCARSW